MNTLGSTWKPQAALDPVYWFLCKTILLENTVSIYMVRIRQISDKFQKKISKKSAENKQEITQIRLRSTVCPFSYEKTGCCQTLHDHDILFGASNMEMILQY